MVEKKRGEEGVETMLEKAGFRELERVECLAGRRERWEEGGLGEERLAWQN